VGVCVRVGELVVGVASGVFSGVGPGESVCSLGDSVGPGVGAVSGPGLIVVPPTCADRGLPVTSSNTVIAPMAITKALKAATPTPTSAACGEALPILRTCGLRLRHVRHPLLGLPDLPRFRQATLVQWM
jgi:hypothetical protein